MDPTDYVALVDAQRRVDDAEAEISSLEDEWLELADRLGLS